MIKLTFCLVRRPEFTREAFQAYWFDRHAPLVASVGEVLRIRRYVQLHSLPVDASAALRVTRAGPEGFDGVAQLWWDSLEDMAATGADPKAAEAGRLLLEDERKFIDLERSPLWWGEEKVIF
ncbi:MAG TPA: EthD domain-containing protein [Caulobacteraceae bacterium]